MGFIPLFCLRNALPLADALMRTLKASGKVVELSDGGLLLRVSPLGNKNWQCKYSLPGMVTTATLRDRRASHDEKISATTSGLCRRRLSGNGPHGWHVEPAALERTTVGGRCLGRRHRAGWLVGMEALEGEEALTGRAILPRAARRRAFRKAALPMRRFLRDVTIQVIVNVRAVVGLWKRPPLREKPSRLRKRRHMVGGAGLGAPSF